MFAEEAFSTAIRTDIARGVEAPGELRHDNVAGTVLAPATPCRRAFRLGEEADAAGANQQAENDQHDAPQERASDDRHDPVDDQCNCDDPQNELHGQLFAPSWGQANTMVRTKAARWTSTSTIAWSNSASVRPIPRLHRNARTGQPISARVGVKRGLWVLPRRPRAAVRV